METLDGLFRATAPVSAPEFAAFADSLGLDRDPDSVAVVLRVEADGLDPFCERLYQLYGGVELFQFHYGRHIPFAPARQQYMVAYRHSAPDMVSTLVEELPETGTSGTHWPPPR